MEKGRNRKPGRNGYKVYRSKRHVEESMVMSLVYFFSDRDSGLVTDTGRNLSAVMSASGFSHVRAPPSGGSPICLTEILGGRLGRERCRDFVGKEIKNRRWSEMDRGWG